MVAKYLNPIFATIDIGSNAVRLFIGRIERGRLLTLMDCRQPLRLGKDTFRQKLITRPSALALLKTIHDFKRACDDYEVSQIRAVATSAVRDAKNGAEIIHWLWQKTGITVEIIDGIDEARLIHLAICNTYNLRRHHAFMIDMGGGSLEVILSKQGKIRSAHSLRLGTVRLLERVGVDASYSQYARVIRRELQSWLDHNDEIENLIFRDLFIGTGGNLRALGKLAQKLSGRTHRNLATLDEIEKLVEMLFALTCKKREKLFDLRKDRADVILPAAAIVLEIMRSFNYAVMHVPNVGIKNGLFWQMTATHQIENQKLNRQTSLGFQRLYNAPDL